MNRLSEKYNKEVRPKLIEEFGVRNVMSAPRLLKVVVNAGVGDLIKNQAGMDKLRNDLAQITGQMPSIRKAKVSIASFGIREGMPVGLAVTLRKEKMYSFLDRLFSIVLPRLRDFRGVTTKAFDKFGNYTLGLSDYTVFPEVDLTKGSTPHGIQITIVSSAKNNEESKKLLELLGCPFTKE